MCGIFGIFAAQGTQLAAVDIRRIADALFRLSESRGREAAGLALRTGEIIHVRKRAISASAFVESKAYRELFATLDIQEGVALIGHSRLVTNGSELIHDNNQPVIKGDLVGIHNGIIVNDAALWGQHRELKRDFDIDTEVLVDLIGARLRGGDSLSVAARKTFAEVEGTVSAAILTAGEEALVATNTGSLYYCRDERNGALIFASERYIITTLLESEPKIEAKAGSTKQLKPGMGGVIVGAGISLFRLNGAPQEPPLEQSSGAANRRRRIVDLDRWENPGEASLRRCTRCILPETMPFIGFDEQGVCNYCRDYQRVPHRSLDELEAILELARSRDGSPDCIVAVSGGRDSCYGLHLLKRRLGMNPVAYTYDWGMVTDLARRNQARLCGRLGVEHVLVSADIRRKRSNIRANIEAWLRRPVLGLVPLFMAGDKQYFYHAHQMRKRCGVDLVFMLENQRYEKTGFKSGFCGIDERKSRIYDVPFADKARLAAYYGCHFLTNPRYLNRSLGDTIGAFLSSYALRHDFVPLFEYVEWEEKEVVETLVDAYGWELAPDTKSTWRIGDGTAAFYNFIYYTLAGFTEHDTFRSNQVRAGAIDREEALRRVHEDNAPRWQSMEWYARVIGFDLAEAVRVINNAPRLYGGG